MRVGYGGDRMTAERNRKSKARCQNHRGATSLAGLGEDRLIGTLTRGWPRASGNLIAGVGDDCAVVRSAPSNHLLLLKTDAVVEGVHFKSDAPPAKVGWKALARCLSDIAAMGGTPDAALIALAAPPHTPVAKIRAIYQGLARCAEKFDVTLAGGETVRADQLSLTVTATGWVARHHLVLRSGARPGDVLCVTGRLGGSGAGHHLSFSPRLAEAQWLASKARPSAMMDISDGLAADLPRLCKASRVGADLNLARIPIRNRATLKQALAEGEDFELLFAIPPARLRKIRCRWPFKTAVTEIGIITARPGIRPAITSHGYDHFQKP